MNVYSKAKYHQVGGSQWDEQAHDNKDTPPNDNPIRIPLSC